MRTLTIVIPSYNRTTQLLRLLSLVNSELVKLKDIDNVDVIVRDNSENNETKNVIESSEFISKPWFNYKKNIENVGFDINILNSFNDAKGEYVWFIGDDDIIFEDSIRKVLELIELEPEMLHLPFKQPQGLTIPQYQTSPSIKYWEEPGGIVEQVLKNIKITSFVYRKGSLQVDKEKLGSLYGKSGWMHVILAFEVLLHAKQIKTISITEFLAGSKDKEWQVIEWTPAAYLTSKTFYQHEIFTRFKLNKQIQDFEDNLYINGIEMTLLVISGIWKTKIPMEDYIDFGTKYPFRGILFKRPTFLIKYMIIKFRLASALKSFIKKYKVLKAP